MAANTGLKDAQGRAVYRGSKGGLFVIDNGKKRYVAPAQTELALRLAQGVAIHAAAKASKKKKPVGIGRGLPARKIYAKNEDGTFSINALSLSRRIPIDSAVKVGKQTFHHKSLRSLLKAGNTKHPVTREPLPPEIIRKYGPPPRPRPRPRPRPAGQGPQELLWRAAMAVAGDFGGVGFDDLLGMDDDGVRAYATFVRNRFGPVAFGHAHQADRATVILGLEGSTAELSHPLPFDGSIYVNMFDARGRLVRGTIQGM